MAIIGNNLIKEWNTQGGFALGNEIEFPFNFVDLTRTTSIILSVDKTYDIFVNRLIIDYQIDGRNESNRHWEFNLYRVNTSLGFSLLNSSNSLPNSYDSLAQAINLEDRIGLNNTLYYTLEATEIGRAGTLSLSGKLVYQHTRNL